MHFVGLDLAWGLRNRSGIAVLDTDGDLLFVGSAITDADILNALAPYVDGPCQVAIDAPLVVNNLTGMRAAERELSADYWPFDAGALPAFKGLEPFRDTPRGARLAQQLGLDMDPYSTGTRRAFEVYPHPATVALFRVGRTLKYKRRRGKSVEARRAAMLELVRLIEGVADHRPPMRAAGSGDWACFRQSVEQATRHVDLNHAEDPIDSVICAYVALYAMHRPDGITIYGDFANGYILTPTLPADLTPTPPARTPTVVAELPYAAALLARVERCAVLTEEIKGLCTVSAEDAAFGDALRRVGVLMELATEQLAAITGQLNS